MLYITFNDYPSGIYYSQVIDVLHYLNQLSNQKIKLIAFISIRNFFENRKKIKKRYSYSIVCPMIPGVQRWKWNKLIFFWIALFHWGTSIMCRGVLAFDIAYTFLRWGLLKHIILDARGAYKAEFEEYLLLSYPSIIQNIDVLEKHAIEQAHFKLAVSQSLVNYWKDVYQYQKNNHVVIPCTLPYSFVRPYPTEEWIKQQKAQYGYSEKDVIVVFAGSLSGWHSLNNYIFLELLRVNPHIKLLFIGKYTLESTEYADRIQSIEVPHDEVIKYLYISDYGWLLREKTMTNKVASPVKFAEYLAGGLKILISEYPEDYAKFCREHACGYIIDWNNISQCVLNPIHYSEKLYHHQLAINYFTKEKYQKQYLEILKYLQ